MDTVATELGSGADTGPGRSRKTSEEAQGQAPMTAQSIARLPLAKASLAQFAARHTAGS